MLAGEGGTGGDEVGRRALEHDPAAVVAGAGAEVAAAIDAHAPYIAAETLATELSSGGPTGEAFTAEVKAGKSAVTVGLTRVGSSLDER